MKMIKPVLLLFVAFLFAVCTVMAQSPLVKGQAFAKKANYGREQKDLDGNPVARPDSLYFVYLELKGKEQPQITSVRFNGRLFQASVVAVEESRVVVGRLNTSEKEAVLQRHKTTRLWRVELTPAAGNMKSSKPAGLFLSGRSSGKTFIFTTPRWTILAADIMG